MSPEILPLTATSMFILGTFLVVVYRVAPPIRNLLLFLRRRGVANDGGAIGGLTTTCR